MKTLLASVWILSMGACAAQIPPVPLTAAVLKQSQALRAQGRIEEAAAELEKIGVHLAPGGKQMSYLEYAITQYKAGHLQAAADAYRQGIFAAPNTSIAGLMHYELGTLRDKQQNYAQAVPEYRAALKLQDKQTAAWTCLLLGDDLKKLGRVSEARSAWTQALTANDDAETGARQIARARLKTFKQL